MVDSTSHQTSTLESDLITGTEAGAATTTAPASDVPGICAGCGFSFTGHFNRRYCSTKCRLTATRKVRNAGAQRRRSSMAPEQRARYNLGAIGILRRDSWRALAATRTCEDCGAPFQGLAPSNRRFRCAPCQKKHVKTERTAAQDQKRAIRDAMFAERAAAKEKECVVCHVVKPIDDYGWHDIMLDQHESTCRACALEIRLADPGRADKALRNRARNWARDLALPFEFMLAQLQKKICDFCAKPETALTAAGATRNLCVEHCHTTKLFRGMACMRCNAHVTALELQRDEPELHALIRLRFEAAA